MDSKLLKACAGASASRGGLNLSEFRSSLIREFPRKEKRVKAIKTRKELEEYCRKDRNIRARMKRQSFSPKAPKASKASKDYFKAGSTLTSKEKKMCRCIAHVSAKNPDKCYSGSDPEWKRGRDSPNCKNPYAICRSRIKGGGKIHCYDEYDFRKMPDDEVRAVKKLHGKK